MSGTSTSTGTRRAQALLDAGLCGLLGLIDALDFVFINDAEARLYTGAASLADAIISAYSSSLTGNTSFSAR